MYEYAVSDGEGTLLMLCTVYEFFYEVERHENRMWITNEDENWQEVPLSSSIIFAPCGEDCETGK